MVHKYVVSKWCSHTTQAGLKQVSSWRRAGGGSSGPDRLQPGGRLCVGGNGQVLEEGVLVHGGAAVGARAVEAVGLPQEPHEGEQRYARMLVRVRLGLGLANPHPNPNPDPNPYPNPK